MATQKIYGVYHTDFRENGGGGSTPSSTIIVNGIVDSNTFTPDEGEPSFVECAEAFKDGTTIMLKIDDGGTLDGYAMITEAYLSDEIGADNTLGFMYDGDYYVWHHPDYDEGGDEEPLS